MTIVTRGDNRNYTPALIALAVLYFMMGLITVLNDTLVPFFKEGFVLTYSQSSLVQFYFFLTYAIMSIPAGKVVEKIGYKHAMVCGFVISSVGALMFLPASWFHEYSLFLAALFIVAIGIVLLQVAANPYVTVLGSPETAASRLTLIQGIGSMGTTIGPIVGAQFILSRLHESNTSSDAVVKPYLFIGLTLLLVGFVISRLHLPNLATASTDGAEVRDEGSIFRFRNLNLGIVGLFAYVGAEVAIGTFLTNYISDSLAIKESAANMYLSLYWGGMLVGRFIGAVILKYINPPMVLTILSFLAAALVVISITSTGLTAVWCMVAIGLCNSVMFAIIFSLSVKGLGKYTTRASGLLSSAIVGGAIMSYAQGMLKDNYSWQVAFIIPLVCYLYLIFYGMSGHKSRLIQ